MFWPPLLAATVLALVHLFAGHLRFLDVVPRSRWLSGASGVSLAYVFVHILPELAASQEDLSQAAGNLFAGALEHHVYLVALLGLTTFYGLERMVRSSRGEQAAETGDDRPSAGVFWLHIGSFALYNVLIGYLLFHREEPGLSSLVYFAVAMSLHFLVNDYGLRQDHKEVYDHRGRWILAGAVLAGWGLGALMAVSKAAVAVLFSALAGGVILNVLKEELPEERQSRFWALVVGVVVYTGLLLLSA